MYDKVTAPAIVKEISQGLCLPLSYCQLLSADRSVCIVNDEWIKSLHRGHVVPLSGTESIDTCKIEKYLSRSCDQVPLPWMRISIKAVAKSDDLFEGLPGQFLYRQWSCGSLYEFMSHITKENMTNLWLQAHNVLKGNKSSHPPRCGSESFTDVVKQLLMRLRPQVYINLQDQASFVHHDQSATNSRPGTNAAQDNSSSFSTGSSKRQGSFYTTSETQLCHSIVPIDIVVESQTHFFIVQPYYQYTLRDAVTFSPTILESSHAKPLFVVYQLLHAMHALHNHGLQMGDIQISDIVMDKNMWLRVTSPRLNILRPHSRDLSSPNTDSGSMYITANSPDVGAARCTSFSIQDLSHVLNQQHPDSPTSNEKLFQAATEFMNAQQYRDFEIVMLDSVVDAWVHRQITNFQYLMILNHLAGRQMGDPNNHPVLPWVLDFSAPDTGYRDLTKSKFRLNKGDGQLDFTYSGMYEINDSGDHIPHHVSDILSDITYYVYKARRTPKTILCAHVRSNWVPNEYPISMQRLQDWTPDECIPEFFTDPTIFDSIHEDLPDLEIPPWSKNTVDFVVRHLGALESDYVSSNLHHWIDLTFGYKLTGVAAVKAKNVHLHLADQHTYLTSRGVAQLFQQPHPQRQPQPTAATISLPRITRGLLNSQLLTIGLPESEADSHYFDASFDTSELGRINQAPIHLPKNYNPLTELEQCETLLEFKAKSLHVPGAHSPGARGLPMKYQDEGVTEDMVTLMCLVCEIFLDSRLRMQDSHLPLWKRVKTIRKICSSDFSEIQRPLQRFICDMFQSLEVTQDKKFIFQAIFPDGSPPPTPGFLIQPYSDLIPFPPYFAELYCSLSKIEEKSLEIENLRRSKKPVMERANKIKQLEREKVPLIETFLWRHQGYMGSEGIGLVLPYIQDLLQNEFTTVQTAWSLFDVTTRELGPTDASKQFLPSLTALFSGEISSAKHIKLYHRSFLIQLIIRLGLKTFLTYFSTLLVEAVAGYKDFSVTSRFYPEELLEDLNQDTLLKSPRASHKPVLWPQDQFRPTAKSEDIADGTIQEEESVDTDREKEEREDLRKDVSGGQEEEDDLADEITLDGAHVLLEDESLDEKPLVNLGDSSERDSIGSESSDDRPDVAMARRRMVMFEDQEMAMGGTYGSADQHSIHSISLIIPKYREDSPNVLEDIDPFRSSEDTDTEAKDSDPPFYRSHNSFARDLQDQAMDRQAKGGKRGSSSNSVFENQAEFGKAERRESSEMGNDSRQLEQSMASTVKGSSVGNASDFDEEDGKGQESEVFLSQETLEGEDTPSAEEDEPDGESQMSGQSRPRTQSDMVRSETEDLMMNLSQDSSGSIINIRDIAADSVKWLCHKLGPVLATKFLSRNLVRMLALCYLGQEQLQFVENRSASEHLIKTSRLVVGDLNAHKVLECIGFTVVLYGEQVILIQCLPNIMDMITVAQKRLSPRSEGGLIAAVVLLSFLIPYISDCNLMNLLEDSIIYSCISPVITITTSPTVCFPGGALARFVLCHKLIDLMYILGIRLGFEMTRKFLTNSMQRLFDTFSSVHGDSFTATESIAFETPIGSGGSDDSFLNIKMDYLTHQYKIGSPVDLRTFKSPPKRHLGKMHSLSSIGIIDDKDDYIDPRSPSSTAEKCAQELKCVFSPELAQACYIPLCRIFGSIHMEDQLRNEDLIRKLCSQHDVETDLSAPKSETGQTSSPPQAAQPVDDLMTPTEERPVVSGIGSNVAVVGNRIQLHEETPPQPEVGQFGRGYKHSGILSIHVDDLRSSEMEQNKSRHLRGNWLAYWERELGLHERDTMFNFMQIELQTYTGHTSSIRSLYSMDTENCFISASKDKTVRLWSIDSSGDGMKKQACQFCYSRHKKSVFSVAYVESMRLVASCDSTVHIWDPYTGVAVSQLESPKYAPVVAITALPAPSTLVAMATTEATLRFLDMRTSKYTHSFRCSVGSTGKGPLTSGGLIRCVVVSPDGIWMAVGFSTGVISLLDVNSGILLHYWKAHDGEILQLKAYNKSRLLSSAFDQTIKLWNVDNGQEVCSTKSQSDPVHCLSLYRDQLLSATTGNRISVYASVTDSTPFTSSKMRQGSFKGVLTHMSVLPLNKALLLGADNGIIRLMA